MSPPVFTVLDRAKTIDLEWRATKEAVILTSEIQLLEILKYRQPIANSVFLKPHASKYIVHSLAQEELSEACSYFSFTFKDVVTPCLMRKMNFAIVSLFLKYCTENSLLPETRHSTETFNMLLDVPLYI